MGGVTHKNHRTAAPCFADADHMKEKVREAILQPDFTVFDYYHREGLSQAIARSPAFDACTLCVIMANAIWLSVETDYNDEALLVDADPGFQVVEHLFCLYFAWEWLVRFMAFERKSHCIKDMWFLFDSLLVLLIVLETWVLTVVILFTGGLASTDVGTASLLRIMRIFRLTRAARVARLLRAIPELMVVVRGIMVVTRTVFLILCLLMIILYVFAVMFTQLAKESSLSKTHFPSVPRSMVNLMLGGILPDMAPWTYSLGNESIFIGCLFFVFVLLAFITIMNMLVGVLVEVVGVVATVEKESNQVQAVKMVLVRLLDELDSEWEGDGKFDGKFSQDHFRDLIAGRRAGKMLHEVGVDAVALIDYADFVFRDQQKLDFADLLDLLLQLRGGNSTKVKDLVELRKFLQVEMRRLEATVSSLRGEIIAGIRTGNIKCGHSHGPTGKPKPLT